MIYQLLSQPAVCVCTAFIKYSNGWKEVQQINHKMCVRVRKKRNDSDLF